MLDKRIDEIFSYVQERCLWQFFSRTWDRQENIDGVLDQAVAIIAGKAPNRATPMERLHYADATIMVDDLRERFPWVKGASEKEISEVMEAVKARLVDAVITKSTNRELTHHLY
jgi:nitrogenase delta subunit